MISDRFQAIVDKIFSYDVFRGLDRASLVAEHDRSAALYDVKSAIRAGHGQSEQAAGPIDSIPAQGIIITQPGTYQFGRDITWSPAASGSSVAITIACNDVILDLAGHMLQATVQDNSQFIVGISIQGVSGVTVRNGVLVNMCFYGICAEEVSALTVQDITVTGMNFTNLAIRNACPAGIHIDKAVDINITGCTVQYMYVTSDASACIQILNTSGGQVAGCRVSNLVNYDGSAQGYGYIGSSGITTSNCSADALRTYFGGNIRAYGHTVLGFCPIFCIDLAYENCTATNITGSCDDAHGMSVFLDALITVSNFTASNVVDGPAPYNTGAKATGLEVYGAGVAVSNCSVSNITAINPQDRQSAGFSAWGAAITFENCAATNVVVCDQHGAANPALGHGVGFGWAPDPRKPLRDIGAYNVEYRKCTAGNCQVGFDTWFHVNSTWEHVSYTGCGTGILVEPDGKRTLSGNPASECNPPITVTLTNMASGNTYPKP